MCVVSDTTNRPLPHLILDERQIALAKNVGNPYADCQGEHGYPEILQLILLHLPLYCNKRSQVIIKVHSGAPRECIVTFFNPSEFKPHQESDTCGAIPYPAKPSKSSYEFKETHGQKRQI